MTIIDWEDKIQLFLDPYLFKIGIEKLSTSGAHKNLSEYVKTIQAKKPIKARSIPISASQTPKVEKIRM
jgi:hypothetical protein